MMDAYAVLGGGGMKGIALAGCLAAASDRGITFKGYGGTSAGALVALLAAIGYKPAEISRIFVKDLDYSSFFDDQGARLNRLEDFVTRLQGPFSAAYATYLHWDLIGQLRREHGLYSGDKVRNLIREKIVEKIPELETTKKILFSHIAPAKSAPERMPLKVVTTNVASRSAQVHGTSNGCLNGCVVSAVWASMCYPFAFKPVPMDQDFWVDGGLSSNLPVFLFQQEMRVTARKVFAFDLVLEQSNARTAYDFKSYCGDMIDTALQASDSLLRESVSKDIVYVPVTLPRNTKTFKLDMSDEEKKGLFEKGENATNREISKKFELWTKAVGQIERLQSQYEVPPAQMRTVLKAVAADFENATGARNVRANIMLPTGHDSRIIVYQYGMDSHADVDLELDMNAGCSGRAWSRKQPTAADLDESRNNFDRWGLTRAQQAKIHPEQKSLFSFPLFRLDAGTREATGLDDLEVLGVVSVDSPTPLADTGWIDDLAEVIDDLQKNWSGVISRMLS